MCELICVHQMQRTYLGQGAVSAIHFSAYCNEKGLLNSVMMITTEFEFGPTCKRDFSLFYLSVALLLLYPKLVAVSWKVMLRGQLLKPKKKDFQRPPSARYIKGKMGICGRHYLSLKMSW